MLGWNTGRRQEINLGSKTHQTFVQISTARLKNRISQLCERHGIRFIETKESSTSKPSFLDSDELPTFGGNLKGGRNLEGVLSADCIAQKMDSKLMQTVIALQIFCQKYRQL